MTGRTQSFSMGPIMAGLVLVSLTACDGGDGTDTGSGGSDGAIDNQAPEAVLKTVQTPILGEVMPLDASESSDPDGDALSYRWQLIAKPDGSNAELDNPGGETAGLVPDRAGEYEIRLVVEDSQGATDRAIHSVASASLFDSLVPQADFGDDRRVGLDESVAMALSLPELPGGEEANQAAAARFDYQWSLEQQPISSAAGIRENGRQGELTPDAPGHYRVSLTVADGEQEWTFTKTLFADDADTAGARLDAPMPETVLVNDATFDFLLPRNIDSARVSEDPDTGERILRDEIDIQFIADATARDVNDALANINGSIVAMTGGTQTVLVRIPDPGSLGELRGLVDDIESNPLVANAVTTTMVPPPDSDTVDTPASSTGRALPAPINAGNTNDMRRTNHHLAVRGYGAWNMRQAIPDNLNERPWLVIGDYFGDGDPDGDYAAVTRRGDYASFGQDGSDDDCENNESCSHGYHVLGIALGRYGNGPGNANRDQVTGMFPAQLRVRAVDMSVGMNMARLRRELVRQYEDIVSNNGNARIVATTSVGLVDPNSAPMVRARLYIRAIDNANLENNVLHTTSAGNAERNDSGSIINRWPARWNSFAAAAGLSTSSQLNTVFFNLPPLDNIMVVENRTNSGTAGAPRHQPQCLANGSLASGNISGIGSGVWSFGRTTQTDSGGSATASDSRGASNKSGTSMSTPQVAGLAAYAFALNPGMTAPDLVDLIRSTGRSDYTVSCSRVIPQPVIDAFDVVRNAGGEDAVRALMDVADGSGNPGRNGRFDMDDIELLLSGPSGSPSLTYGRFDPNADGYRDPARSSSRTERVDLNRDGNRGTVQLNIDGYQKPFDETAVTDLDVLCHEAFTTAYDGSDQQRNERLGERCGIVAVDINHPVNPTITEGDRLEVTADVTLNGDQSGDVTLHTGGQQRDVRFGYGPSDSVDVTLSTQRVCPGQPTVDMRFTDTREGFTADDTLNVNVDSAALHAAIVGRKPRYVRVQSGPSIPDMSFEGRGHEPTCEDPNSARLNQDNVVWRDDSRQPLTDAQGNRRTGRNLTLTDDYLADGSGGFQQRRLAMSFSRDGQTVYDDVLIKPCSSDIGQNVSSPSGYPECPSSAVAGDVQKSLESTFGTSDPDEVEQLIGLAAHGRPDFRNVLDELGKESCDPRFCDPPGFIKGLGDISNALVESGRFELVKHVEQLFVALDAGTTEEARDRLQTVADAVAGDETLSDDERALFKATYSAAMGALDQFAREETGGNNGWTDMMSDDQVEQVRGQGDPLRPARMAAAGHLSAVIDGGIDTGYEESKLANDAAAYGGAIGAIEEAEKVRRDESDSG